jgi:autotransporter-associated beta strand protein
VGGNSVTLANAIGNSGPGGLNKTGSGTLRLNGNNNYSGNTLISQGVMALGVAGALPNSGRIILSNNAILDVSSRNDGTLTLGSSKQLIGNGTVRGSVIASSGSTIAPGFSIGTLAITNALNFQANSTNLMELDATAHTNDLLTGMTAVNYAGRLIVTNLSGTLAAGDSFKLFGAGSYNGVFTSITLPTLNGNLIWTNKLVVDGTIAVVSPVNTTPTDISVAAVGKALHLTWPADRTGWRLEAQTNNLYTGLRTNWISVLGSTESNQITIPIDAANGSVFYRLVYP